MVTEQFKSDFRRLAVELLKDTGHAEFTASHEGRLVGTPYGDVRFHLFDDWCAFRLVSHPGYRDGSPNWRGWDHWKQNYHTFASQTKIRYVAESYREQLSLHIKRFFAAEK